ncbi:Detected protein of unknown function [Hibiscus syriacus]|uniref:ZF-HD dimerization-type domain-containing protein n=1 Tax=Hibiscus syriacus TaxID=106335 RepID=A0A6A3B7X5_HIBSY|nr:zinc-finger homeodomain protein 5-like [Hibiscus syriacus]KAE8712906.1 Detected protein of unknown function [Hibiscus syriacus]
MEVETRSNDVIKLETASDVELVPDQSTDRISRYKECRRNHAASFGRYAIDGCREFICCKDDVFTCAACGCHRSFHRKDHPSYGSAPPFLAPLPLASHNGLTGETCLFSEADRNINKRARRSKLTVDQKNKMMGFADKLGWRSQLREKDAEIQRFCEEVGITKRVFIVWLNNNRHRRDHASQHMSFGSNK